MSYLAIYRRFRPTTFSEVVGQEHVVTTLINQIKTERIGHAYLFCGARGTGKTTVARIFARAINCQMPVDGSPCGKCEVCEKLSNSSTLDIIEIDAASNNKVDNVQEIRANVQYPPVAGKYKVYIIDEVHMLTTEAFNALLKTLEEPPEHAVFILATTEPHKLPATILSRCMRFDFHLVADKVIENLIEKIYDDVGKQYEKEATSLIAKSGEGSIRDALSLADLCISYSNEKLTYKQVIDILGASDSSKTAAFVKAILNSDVGTVLSVIDELTGLGKSVSVLTKDVLSMIRDVLVVKTCRGAKDILMLPESEFDRLSDIASLADNHRFLRVLEIFTAIETDLRYSTHPRIVFEAAAVKAALPSEDYNIDALVSRVSSLEKTVESLLKNGLTIKKQDLSDTPKAEKVEGVKTENSKAETNVAARQNIADTQPTAIVDDKVVSDEKSAYKPVIEEKSNEKSGDFGGEKRLSAFDYISSEDVPVPDESYAPPEDQISFVGFDEAVSFTRKTVITDTFESLNKQKSAEPFAPVQNTASAKEANNSVVRDRVPDARLWGSVIRKLRSEKHIMLWIACQELDAEISDGNLVILVEGENEYNLLVKKESLDTLQSVVSSLAPYVVKIKRIGQVENDDDKFRGDAEKVKEMFDGKITIED